MRELNPVSMRLTNPKRCAPAPLSWLRVCLKGWLVSLVVPREPIFMFGFIFSSLGLAFQAKIVLPARFHLYIGFLHFSGARLHARARRAISASGG